MSTKSIDIDTIQQENKDLKIELKKTLAEKKQVEKALAERSALYALKKKAESLFFGGGGDSEEG